MTTIHTRPLWPKLGSHPRQVLVLALQRWHSLSTLRTIMGPALKGWPCPGLLPALPAIAKHINLLLTGLLRLQLVLSMGTCSASSGAVSATAQKGLESQLSN